MPSMPRPNRRSRMSCSAIALATVMVVGASPAAAQSFQGEGVFTHGTGSIAVPDSTTTNISVTSGQAVIDWSPFDTEGASGTNIVFQPGGTTATFSSGSNFAVLNRINPADSSRAIGMDGAINGLVNGQTGGNIYFYSPSGFILGATSAINVGSLVLSASPLQLDANGNFINGTSVQFNQAPNASARIVANPGSTINALNEGSYVAMVAPRVQHHGTIAVNGSAALVGAEAATVNFSPDGLFDIQVTVGTTDTGGVAVHGDIGGPASTGGTDNHRVYMVAVPKNDALTMVIGAGSDLGFTLAGSAAIDDMGAVVLSAGHDISGGGIGSESAAAGDVANISFHGAHATSNLFGEASGFANFFSSAGATTTFDSDVTVHAVDHIFMNAFGSDALLTVTGDLNLSTDAIGAGDGESATGGWTALYASVGGSVTVGGNVTVTADGVGGDAFESPAAGNGTGGQVLVQAEPGGTLSIGGSLDASADGYGGEPGNQGIDAGNGTGGSVFIGAFGTGSNFTVAGTTFATAEGHGGDGRGISNECFDCNGAGGFGLGGTVSIGALADSGAVAEFGGSVDLSAAGFGGAAGGLALAGNGSGGVAQADIGTNATLTVTGNLTLNADGHGGDGDSFGGTGDGGIANISSDFGPGGGSTFTVNGNSSVTADGYGGSAFGSGGNGGDAFGGDAFVGGDSNVFAFIGDLTVSASAYGGDVEIGTGGAATGGVAGIVSNGANIQVSNDASVLAEAYGGVGEIGGAAFGGFARFESEFNLGIGDSAFASASAYGGHGFSGDGGDGHGGAVSLTASGGDLTFGGPLFVAANGTGGGSSGEGTTSGDGFGGTATIEAGANSSLIIAGLLFADAIGRGGFTESFGINGGDGTGGTVNLLATGGNAVLDVGNSVFLSADGEAGSGGECISCGGIGGDGIGGNVFVGANGVESTIDIAAALNVSANGYGGIGVTGNAGNGTGGLANLTAGSGGTITLGQDLTMTAEGYGGMHINSGLGGIGTGGTAEVITDGTTGALISLQNGVSLYADGFGGSSFSEGGGGTGGDGFGGIAQIVAQTGAIEVGGFVELSGSGEGGFATFGTGGDGFGKHAEIAADGGTVTINSSASVQANGLGGNGDNGGSGTGGGDGVALTDGAHIYARNGSVTIDGSAFISADGSGGNGDNGGNGGDGTGGWATIHAANSNLGPSTITIQGVESGAFVSANGFGGFGGNGQNGFSGFSSGPGEAGGDGGDGGAGTGGIASITASAGNGHVTIDYANASAFGQGGDSGSGGTGGTGGNAEIGAGGNGGAGGTGGAGGAATGGSVTVGTQSGSAQATASNLGTGTYGSIYADGSAYGGAGGTGGAGGAGGFGSPSGAPGADGSGGVGGIADGGSAVLLVRGSLVDAGFVQLWADGNGGGGGSGGGGTGVMGVGGDGIAGEVGVLATSRFLIPAQRGTLNAGAIFGSATGTGGSGSTPGASIVEGGSFFQVENADATIGSVDIVVDGTSVAPGADASRITVINGTVDVTDGFFAFSTIGDLSLHLANNGLPTSLTVDNFILSAGDFVPDSINPPPGNPGTIFAGTAFIATGNNFIADANIDTVNDLVITAPGSIRFDQAISDGSVDLWAQSGSIIIEGVDAGTSLNLLAATSVGTDDILAGTTVDIEAQGGSIGTGHVEAGGDVFLLADTSIEGDDVITFGNVFAQAQGGDLALANIEGWDIALDASGNLSFGDILADGAVGLTAGGAITGGDVTANGLIFASGIGAVDLGDLTTNAPLILFSEGDGITIFSHTGGPSIEIFSETSVVTGNINSAEDVIIGSGGSIETGNGGAVGFIDMFADGDIDTLDLTAGLDIDLEAGGALSFGNGDAGTEFEFEAVGDVSGGNILAGITVEGEAGGAITLDDITAGYSEGVDDDTFAVGIVSATSIDVGDVDGARRVGFATLGDLTTGSINAGWDFMALVGGDITTGAITTSGEGQVYMADASMCETGGGCASDSETDFDPEIVLALDPVPTGGSITINGPVSTGLFRAAAGDDLTAQAITAGNIIASAGGTATINGQWNANAVTLSSNDIDISASGGIDANGLVTLISTNGAQALIGDGLSGSGYALSNAEFGRIEGGSVHILARGDASAAQDMLIGDLTVTGPSAGSTVEDSEGILVFATGDVESETPAGVIRVVGDVSATGFGSANAMEFYAGRFELDAATGSIVINSSSATLGGELGIYADQIHVASGALLDQLADNPQFSGYIQALNDPAEVQRPEGVLNAASIWIESDNLQSILIQNTGTAQTPAGFTANEIFVNDDFEIAGPPGSIDVVANGQLVTEGGTLTGVAVRDALVEGEDLSPFTATSTINGCQLTGQCFDQPPPIPDVVDSQIDLIGLDLLGDGEFGNEPEIDDGEEGDENADSPISPPHPLFDTRPLVPGGEVNDPVSGTGNPALLGNPDDEEDDEEDGEKKGDGQ